MKLAGGKFASLPTWFQKCGENVYQSNKNDHNLEEHHDYNTLLSAPLIKMSIKQNWVGKNSNITRPLLVNATGGLSPFLVMVLTEDQVASINKDDEALAQALYVTLQDIMFLKLMTPEIPDTADGFVVLLKRYANLNFSLFSKTSTLFRALVKIIDSIKDFY